jgi:hypothetical protein
VTLQGSDARDCGLIAREWYESSLNSMWRDAKLAFDDVVDCLTVSHSSGFIKTRCLEGDDFGDLEWRWVNCSGLPEIVKVALVSPQARYMIE